MRKLSPLTASECDYAAEHFPIVHAFLRRKRLPEDEWFDVVVFGYLEAVHTRFRVPVAPERDNFRALACVCMEHAIAYEWKYRYAEKRRGPLLSLDYIASANTDDGDLSLYAILDDPRQDVSRLAEARDLLERAHARGTRRELEAMDLLADGYSIAEAAARLGVSERKCRDLLRSIRGKTEAAKHEYAGTDGRRCRTRIRGGYR